MVTSDKFVSLTDTVIQNFEGGYYHPNMYGRVIKDVRYKSSGETMFGIDRKHGISLSKNPAWNEFWGLIDKAGAKTKWKWNYMGGILGPTLRSLAGKIMYPHFMALFNKYLNTKAQQAVANDPRLVIHFSYASWNGPGWFQKFSSPLNLALNKGFSDKELIYRVAIEARTKNSNSLIRQHGATMIGLFAKMNLNNTGPEPEKKKFFDAFNPRNWFSNGVLRISD
jgi:hypothetical protein